MILLSANDFDYLQNAMSRNEETILLRTMGDVIVRVKTLRADPPWPVHVIAQVQVEYANIAWTQNFSDLSDAKTSLEACLGRLL